jgi:hypothetical protein
VSTLQKAVMVYWIKRQGLLFVKITSINHRNSQQTNNSRELSHMIKEIYEKPTANIILNDKNLNTLSQD